jgi:signal transduction histidine kinase
LIRYELDGTATLLANEGATGDHVRVGERWQSYPPTGLTATVLSTGLAARVDDYRDVAGGDLTLSEGIRSAVALPIHVDGRLWGMIAVGSGDGPLPPDTEQRMTEFTDLVATAVANAQNRDALQTSNDELARLLQEQAALRRVATLVARAVPPEEVFTAVTAEIGTVLDVDLAVTGRYDSDGAATILGTWTRTGAAVPLPADGRVQLGGSNVTTRVFQTGRPARLDSYSSASGPAADMGRDWGLRSFVGVPISVDNRTWGVVIAAHTQERPLPPDAETRLAGFTELVATSIVNAHARVELRCFAEEQAALRQVATLVARAASPEEVFTAVAEELGQLLKVDYTVLSRYDPDGMVSVVGGWARTDPGRPLDIGLRLKAEGRNIHALVFERGRPARIDDYDSASGAFADVARDWQYRSSVGAPIHVQGRLWGVMIVASREQPLPPDIEVRLAGFTELVATALANAEAQAALTASRARIVATADATRRRIERDLHDGTQQRLVSLGLGLRLAQSTVPAELPELEAEIGQAAEELNGVVDDLREIARGIHPAILSEGGLGPALRTLARRAAIAVELEVAAITRLPEPIEVAAYYVVSEAVTNATKHAHASVVKIVVGERDNCLHLSICDDGVGGVDTTHGSGVIGLRDRAEALGGSIELSSPPGEGTKIAVRLPLQLS